MQFDTLPLTNLGAVQNLPQNPIDGLYFGGFRYRSNGLPVAIASSSPNYITFGGLTTPVVNITAEYAGSNVKSYALTSANVACVVAAVGNVPPIGGVSPPAVGEPLPCGVRFSGVNTAGSRISQTCQYSGTMLNAMAQLCVFDEAMFGSVETVVVEVVTTLTTEITAGIVDDVAHTNKY